MLVAGVHKERCCATLLDLGVSDTAITGNSTAKPTAAFFSLGDGVFQFKDGDPGFEVWSY
jgi:hypothetical protein